ncbi:unnamed protein product [Mortierella alpina]
MDQTQSFRLIGTTQIVTVPVLHVGGQNVVSWESIEQVFPGVKCVKNGDVATFENAFIDTSVGILSAVVTRNSAVTLGHCDAPIDSPADSSSEDKFIKDLKVTSALPEMPIDHTSARDSSISLSISPSSSSSDAETISKTALSFIEALKGASKRAKDPDGPIHRKEFTAKMDRMFQLQEDMIKLQKGSDAKQQEIIKLQVAFDAKQEEIVRLQKEMKQMQQRALDQLSVLQSRVQAVLTQNYELHEYPIPRLFIVLPQYPTGWNILEPFTDKYRLYFLCECGEHTKAAGKNSKIPHEIHLAKHEGVTVPAVAHLINADALDHAAKGLQHLKDCIEPGMDQMISKIEKDSVDEGELVESFTDQMENKEALEGADLRKLESFLKDKDGNKVLGNLYRTVTDEGHVKWVCMDHYRENYNKTAAEAFRRAVDSVGGYFDENNGVVKVTLGSRVSATNCIQHWERQDLSTSSISPWTGPAPEPIFKLWRMHS